MTLDTSITPGQLGHITDHEAIAAAINAAASGRLVFNVREYGAVGDGTTNDTVAVRAAVTAADAAGYYNIVYFPPGRYKLVGSFSMSGSSAVLRGSGSGYLAGTQRGSVLVGSAQTGPVLNFTGWLSPDSIRGQVEHGGFSVVGDGIADAGKTHAGIRMAAMEAVTFRGIHIANTGGPGLHLNGSSQLCQFVDIVVETPISAKVNNVPYIHSIGPNGGNTFINVGLRSMVASADCGAGGAWRTESDGTYGSGFGTYLNCWAEFLHIPTAGTLFYLSGALNNMNNFQFWDCAYEAGATNASLVRFDPEPTNDKGGNCMTGFIPGDSEASGNYGVDIRQSGNFINGVKGAFGKNAIIASGVQRTTILLGGAHLAATQVAVLDNSGNNTNRIHDYTTDYEKHEDYNVQPGATYGGGPIFKSAADTNKGAIQMGRGLTMFDNGASSSDYIRTDVAATNLVIDHGGSIPATFAGLNGPGLTLNNPAGNPALKLATGWMEMMEIADPGVSYFANEVKLYAIDNGAGKTKLMAKFYTGAAVQIAIEP